MNITGWYEGENGAVLVDEDGTAAAIFERLRERDEDFGLTDMELEDEDGNDYSMAAMIWAETLAKAAQMKSFERTWFALCSDGALAVLGDHGDYEAASATADDLGMEVVWLVCGDDAAQWADAINSQR